MGIAALVQIVSQFLGELLDGELLCLVKAVLSNFLAVVPPIQHWLEVLQPHGLGLGKMLVPFWHIQTVKPGFLGGVGVVKKQDIGSDRRIGREHASRQADDGVKIEFPQQFLFDVHLGIVGTEQKAVRQNHRRPAVLFQTVLPPYPICRTEKQSV